jgi:hypothetical protein
VHMQGTERRAVVEQGNFKILRSGVEYLEVQRIDKMGKVDSSI